MAYDCFDRTTGELSAQSMLDISSVTMQCVKNIKQENYLAEYHSPESTEADSDLVFSEGEDEDEEFYEDESSSDYDEDFAEDENNGSTGQQLKNAAERHLGKLLGNILNNMTDR